MLVAILLIFFGIVYALVAVGYLIDYRCRQEERRALPREQRRREHIGAYYFTIFLIIMSSACSIVGFLVLGKVLSGELDPANPPTGAEQRLHQPPSYGRSNPHRPGPTEGVALAARAVTVQAPANRRAPSSQEPVPQTAVLVIESRRLGSMKGDCRYEHSGLGPSSAPHRVA